MSLRLRSPLLAALLLAAAPLPAAAPSAFRPTPDHEPRPGVPTGTVLPQPAWQSQVFPGTTRDWWLYVPAQYKPDGTAALMIFQDGANYLRPT